MIRPITWYPVAESGQSNALGTNNDSMIGVVMPVVQAVTVQGLVWWLPPGGANNPRVCPAAGVAEALAARGREGLRLCKDAVGGSPIADWISTYGPRHIKAMRRSRWVFKGIVFAQGEQEGSNLTEATNYAARLETLFGLYWAAFPNLHVCIIKVSTDYGGSPPYISLTRAGQDAFGAAHPDRVTVIEGLIAGTQWDGTHGTGPQNRVLGANALAALEAL